MSIHVLGHVSVSVEALTGCLGFSHVALTCTEKHCPVAANNSGAERLAVFVARYKALKPSTQASLGGRRLPHIPQLPSCPPSLIGSSRHAYRVVSELRLLPSDPCNRSLQYNLTLDDITKERRSENLPGKKSHHPLGSERLTQELPDGAEPYRPS